MVAWISAVYAGEFSRQAHLTLHTFWEAIYEGQGAHRLL